MHQKKYQQMLNHVLHIVYRMWRPGQNRIKGLSRGRQPRNIHPRPEARAHRNGRLSRPAEGWKGTSKKVLDSAEAIR